MVLKKRAADVNRLHVHETSTTSIANRLMRFAETQQPNAFGWLAFSFFLQGCVLSPATIMVIVANGNNFFLWIPCILGFAATEIVSLAAMPTKITIPVLFTGIVIDILVVLLSFFI